MTLERIMRRRLIALFLFGAMLVSYPVLSLFNQQILVFGYPLLYVYLYVLWAALIALSTMVLEGPAGKREP